MSKYLGNELELFAHASNWKAYWAAHVGPFLGRDVLDVGAGLGATARTLAPGRAGRWVCLEPDLDFVQELTSQRDRGDLPARCEVLAGTTRGEHDLGEFDTVLYMDVLEHIEDDAAELRQAAALLRLGGHLVVLAPAHGWLFTPFDAAIGHFRRYTKRSLLALAPPGLTPVVARYLDAAGLLASLGNRLWLRSAMPTARQIALWDRGLVPISRWLDRPTGYHLGKSVLVVWTRP